MNFYIPLKNTTLLALLFLIIDIYAQNELSPNLNNNAKYLRYAKKLNSDSNLTINSKENNYKYMVTGEKVLLPNIISIPGNIIPKDALCQPEFQFGCLDGDGFTGFALEQIQNLSNGCENNTGFSGWSEYYNLPQAMLTPGDSYFISMATGFTNQHVNIWIDFNDDLILTSDEMILMDYIIELADTVYLVPVTIPANAPAGQHAMRAMAVWPDTFTDPCGSYMYGEAEDYYVNIQEGVYGSLEGYVIYEGGNNPVEGATINIGSFFSVTSGTNGYYFAEQVLVGLWNTICSKAGCNPDSAIITITQDVTSLQNFELTTPQMLVDPGAITVTIEPNSNTNEVININNVGNGALIWNAYVDILDETVTDQLFDLQFDWPVGFGTGEAGIECDGNYIYTTRWNGSGFYRYELDGTYLGPFSCGEVAGIRDLAYDGTYFYGAAATSTVYQMDFTNGILVSQFTAPSEIRAIAYCESENVFYGNNWGSDIIKFNAEGLNLGSFPVGPVGASYYGFAFDNYSDEGPYLWGYAQTGPSLNELIQIQLPSGIETGVTFDVGSVAAVGTGLAGGLAIADALVSGNYTLLGLAMGVDIWGLELCESNNNWLSIDPESGLIEAGQNQFISLQISSMDLLPGSYNAEIHFNADPAIATPIVEVTLQVEGLIPPFNLNASYDCTNVNLFWDMPPGGEPDSWKVYRDGILIANPTVMHYTDPMVEPEVEYGYYVKAVYSDELSQPTNTTTISIPVPSSLEPVNAAATYQGLNTVQISWEMPETCLPPDEFKVYRNNFFVGNTTTLSFTDIAVPNGYHEYYIKAVYYFGLSENSLPASIIVGSDEFVEDGFQIFPNPASDFVLIKSPVELYSVKFVNSSGKIVFFKKLKDSLYSIELKDIEKGIYLVILKADEGEIVKKIIIN